MRNLTVIGLVVLLLAALAGGGVFFYQKMQASSVGDAVAANAPAPVAETPAPAPAPVDNAAPAQQAAEQPAAEAVAPEPAVAAPADDTAAEETGGYETLAAPQPTLNPDKVEVIEFFWYGCPHCYDFEPILESWVKKMPANVDFIRQPAAFSEQWARHAKAFYVAQALGVLDKVHADFFDTLQNKQQKLDTEEQLTAFFVAHGVKASDVHDAFNSFLVDTKVRQAQATPARYGVTGVPVLIVNGKYKVDGKSAGSHEKMIEVINRLIKKESVAKK